MNDEREKSPLLNKMRNKSSYKPKEVSRKYIEDEGINSSRTPYIINTSAEDYTKSVEINNIAQYSRYKYYSKLHNTPGERLIIPSHVLPRHVFWLHKGEKDEKQSSLVTIFAIWNTMMGTSLLSMPWALQQSGFVLGLGLIVFMSCICLYTCLVVVRSKKTIDDSAPIEFTDICKYHLGRWGHLSSFFFFILAFLGAIMVYWVLMSNFLFKIGKFGHEHSSDLITNVTSYPDAEKYAGVFCKKEQSANVTVPGHVTTSSQFFKFWDQRKTVPFYLVVLLLPLSSFKSPTFFTKFNAFGTISVLYILVFVLVKAIKWGPHLHFQNSNLHKTEVPTKFYDVGFPALTGILALALYIHNAILSILQTNRHQEKNTRDVCTAYFLTAGTYTYIAVVFYSFFPLDKSCIEQVLLDNFISSDVMTFIAHCGLFFQMVAVFPLIMYIVRVQFFGFFFSKTNHGYVMIVLLNFVLISMGVSMAVFYPEVGHIIRYVGSVCGMMCIFALPSLVKLCVQQKDGELNWPSIFFHLFLVFLGFANLVAQFFVAS